MRFGSALIGPVLVAAATVAVPQDLIPIDVRVESVGKGAKGTVVVVSAWIAPEDRALVGGSLELRTTLSSKGVVLEDVSQVVAVGDDGEAAVRREWSPGSYDLSVWVSSEARPAIGFSSGELDVPEADADTPAAAEFRNSDAVDPPSDDAVHFLGAPQLESLEAIHLEVTVPTGTAEVEFFHDTKIVARRTRPPWSIRVSTRDIVRQSRFRAVALDTFGRYLGEDVIVINPPPGERGIEILVAPANAASDGLLPVTVAVTDRIETLRVNLYLDDELVSSWQDCPCITDVPVSDLDRTSILSAEVVDFLGNHSVAVLNTSGGFSGTVRVDLVELQVQVLDSHEVPVSDLDVEDFSVLEDGAEAEIVNFGTAADQPLSLLLAVDSSGSMTDIFQDVRRAVDGFATDLLEPGDRALLMRFATEIEMVVPWSNDPGDIARGMDHVVPGGSTAYHDAIIQSLMELHSLHGRKAVVVLTDGNDTSSFATSADAMWFSRSMRVPVFVITLARGSVAMIARSSDMATVRHRHQVATLAQRSGGQAFFRVNVKQLPKVYAEIAEILRSQYVIWYRPPSESGGDQFHSIEVKVADPNLEVRTISGYSSVR